MTTPVIIRSEFELTQDVVLRIDGKDVPPRFYKVIGPYSLQIDPPPADGARVCIDRPHRQRIHKVNIP